MPGLLCFLPASSASPAVQRDALLPRAALNEQEPALSWTHEGPLNCYSGKGAPQGRNRRGEPTAVRFKDCQQECLDDSKCQAVVFRFSAPDDVTKFAAPDNDRGSCFLLDVVAPERCEQSSDGYHLYTVDAQKRIPPSERAAEQQTPTQRSPSAKASSKAALCQVRPSDPLRVAVLFWGLPRVLETNFPSIEKNVLQPLRSRFDTFAHLVEAPAVQNTHFDEGSVDLPSSASEAWRLRRPCLQSVSSQADIDSKLGIGRLAAASIERSLGVLHPFNDFTTVKNIYRSRFSLYSVGQLAVQREQTAGFAYNVVVAVRPDTLFLSPVPYEFSPDGPPLPNDTLFAPSFSHGSSSAGVNDRFAYGARDVMLEAYTRQWDQQLSDGALRFIDSEHLLCSQLRAQQITVQGANICVVRVRAGGEHMLADYIAPREHSNCSSHSNTGPIERGAALENTCPEPPADADFSMPAAAVDDVDVRTHSATACFPFPQPLAAPATPFLDLPLKLADPTHFLNVSHRGWSNVVQRLLDGGSAEMPSGDSLPRDRQTAWLVDSVEHFFMWGPNKTKVLREPWVGVVHYLVNAPPYYRTETVGTLMQSEQFIASLKHCRALITLSTALRAQLMKLPELAEVPIYALEHPIDAMPGSAWEFEAFRSAWTQRPRVLQVGQQYRQMSSIFLVDAPRAKHVWTPGFDPTEDGWLERLPELLLKEVEYLTSDDIMDNVAPAVDNSTQARMRLHNVLHSQEEERQRFRSSLKVDKGSRTVEVGTDTKVTVAQVDDDAHHQMVRKSVVIVPLWTTSADSAVLEAIASKIPAFVTRLPATEQYLGAEYPMFFTYLDEVSALLRNTSQLFALMNKAHNYLLGLPTDHLAQSHFQNALQESFLGIRKECEPASLDRAKREQASRSYLRVRRTPRQRRPFFFFHVPKVGGSSLRTVLLEDAGRNQQQIFAPCFNGVGCAWDEDEATLPNSSLRHCPYGAGAADHAMACLHPAETACSSIFAGHFGTKLVQDMAQVGPHKHYDCDKQPDWEACSDPLQCIECVVVMREPLDRLISAYAALDPRAVYTPHTRFEDLTEEEQDEVARVLGGNVSLAYLGEGAYDPQEVASRKRLPPSGGSMDRARATLQHCSIGIFERWNDSQALWRVELPWSSLGKSGEPVNEPDPVEPAMDHISGGDLSAERQARLRTIMAADVELYAAATELFEARLQALEMTIGKATESANCLLEHHDQVQSSSDCKKLCDELETASEKAWKSPGAWSWREAYRYAGRKCSHYEWFDRTGQCWLYREAGCTAEGAGKARTCPRCGEADGTRRAHPNCCSPGGSWEGMCKYAGMYTFEDGHEACNSDAD